MSVHTTADMVHLFLHHLDDDSHECEVAPNTSLSKVARDYFEALGLDPDTPPLVTLFDPESSTAIRRLDAEQTLASARVSTGSHLRIVPEHDRPAPKWPLADPVWLGLVLVSGLLSIAAAWLWSSQR